MSRNFPNWLQAYLQYSSSSEAPRRMHFWTGVSTIAGCLRRRVWIDQAYFRWYPNFYIIFVAPPGVVSKTTTASIGMSLLRKVPGIKFGPDVVTWPALVNCFEEAKESFEYNNEFHFMSPLTLESGEFGNLLNPQDREMVDLLVSLWDAKTGGFEKRTKMSGNNLIENPWINIIACTTPAWISGNFPEYMIGGGFTSRCVFIYADQKAQYVPYPKLLVGQNHEGMQKALIEDLEHISTCLCGEYELSPEAIAWGSQWYLALHQSRPEHLSDDRFGGYVARKQSHIHKLAMVLAAAESDQLVLTDMHLQIADSMVTDLEKSMLKVFAGVGRAEASTYADRIIAFVAKRGSVPYDEVYRFIHTAIPSARNFEDVLLGCIRARHLRLVQKPDGHYLEALTHGDVIDECSANVEFQQKFQRMVCEEKK